MRCRVSLRALPIHAARGQLYLPGDLMERYGAQSTDVSPATATTELRAVLAELRLHARHHLGAARESAQGHGARSRSGAAAVALIGPRSTAWSVASYQPFAPSELPQWRRQWILWRGARTAASAQGF